MRKGEVLKSSVRKGGVLVEVTEDVNSGAYGEPYAPLPGRNKDSGISVLGLVVSLAVEIV